MAGISLLQVPRTICSRHHDLLLGATCRAFYSTAPKVAVKPNTQTNIKKTGTLQSQTKTHTNNNAPNGSSTPLNNNTSKNQQRHRAKLGPKPQRKVQPKKAHGTALSLLDEIRAEIKTNLEQNKIHNIQRKIFFAITIPSTPPSVASELFNLAVTAHCVDKRILRGYLTILALDQDIATIQRVFDYIKRIGIKPQHSHLKEVIKCWIGPKNLDMDLLDRNFETIKNGVDKEFWPELYSAYISVFIYKNKFKEVDNIIKNMRKEGVTPNAIFYADLITGITQNASTTEEKLQEVLLMMDKDNIAPNRGTCNAVMNFYVKKGNFEKAIVVGEMMESKGVPFYDDAFVPLIDGFRKEGILEGIVYIISELSSRKMKFSKNLYTSVIAAYCEQKDMESALRLLQTMFQSNVTPEAPTYNCIIKGYLANNDLEGGLKILVSMKEEKVMPNNLTYPLFIEFFRKKNDYENLKQMLQMMRGDHLTINAISYSVALTVAVNNYGFGEEARELLRTMDAEGVAPTTDLFSSVLVSLSKKKDDSAFVEIMDLMDKYQISYHPSTISPILYHYTSIRNYESAWAILQRAMLHRFDLKTLPIPQKKFLKQCGLMHPVENGVFLQ